MKGMTQAPTNGKPLPEDLVKMPVVAQLMKVSDNENKTVEFSLPRGVRDNKQSNLLTTLLSLNTSRRSGTPSLKTTHLSPPSTRTRTLRFSCGARSAFIPRGTKSLEKHAIAPSAARLCWAACVGTSSILVVSELTIDDFSCLDLFTR